MLLQVKEIHLYTIDANAVEVEVNVLFPFVGLVFGEEF